MAKAPVNQLLISRIDAARMLGNISVTTVMRLEKEGVLKPVRLNPRKPTAQVFYRYESIAALAQG
jgi:hypothetical protein